MIKVHNLTKRFPGILALDQVSFDCNPGEVFGLLGPNGAGKTTTIRLILSILSPDDGTIEVNGIEVSREPEKAREKIGAVLEENGVYDRLTARENVALFGRLSGLGGLRLEERMQELFSLLEMGEFAHKRGGGLSKGMAQKVAVARALIADPPILLLDEPTSGLDVLTRRTILELVKEERQRGKCILYSTHVMSEAEQVCDRIGIIHKGRIKAMGSLEELQSKTERENLEEVFVELLRGEQ